MRYTSEVHGSDLGFPWAAVIPAAVSAGTAIFGTIAQERQQEARIRAEQDAQRARLLMQEAQAQIARLAQTLPDRLTSQQAQVIIQNGAESQRAQAESTWRQRFSGLPNSVAYARNIAARVQQAYLNAAGKVQAQSWLAGWGGAAMALGGLGLAGAALYQSRRDNK
jgi:hypothetical protein